MSDETPEPKKPRLISRAPPPITPVRGGSSVLRKKTKAPDWDYWRRRTEVKLWEAAFLSCDIDPDSQSYGDIADNEKVSKRLRVLLDNKSQKNGFKHGDIYNAA